jgi:hypothetical protein
VKSRPFLDIEAHAVSLARQATIMTFDFGLSPMSTDTDQLPFAHRLPAISSRNNDPAPQ